MSVKNAIEVNNLSKTYKDFQLKNINFNLEKGTIMGLVGANGSGDSAIMMTDTINPVKSRFKDFHKTFKQDGLELNLSFFLLN